jgi:hypothetical protein
MRTEEQIRELVQNHTYTYKGITYRVALWRMESHKRSGDEPIGAWLHFTASPTGGKGDPIRLELHLSAQNISDDVYLLDAVSDTIKEIVDGKFPPGARKML